MVNNPAVPHHFTGALVVLAMDGGAQRVGAIVERVYAHGLLLRDGREVRWWVSWVDLGTGHATLAYTPDARAIMQWAARQSGHSA